MVKAAVTMLAEVQVMQTTVAAFRVLCLGVAAVIAVGKTEVVTVLQARMAPVGVATAAVAVDVDVGEDVGQPVEAAERVAAKVAAAIGIVTVIVTGLLQSGTVVLNPMAHGLQRHQHHRRHPHRQQRPRQWPRQQWARQQHPQHQQQHHQHQQHPRHQQHTQQQHPQHQQLCLPSCLSIDRRPRLWGKETS